jgi:hypothetical protein
LRHVAKTAGRLAAAALACLAISALPSWSENPESEIVHLLSYVEQSSCTFIRNDKDYTASYARSHLERKYGYAKSKIQNADQFIEYVGAGSSRSGKPYRIRCGEHEYTAGEWLATELSRFRASPKPPAGETSGG